MQQATDPEPRTRADWPSLIAIVGICIGWFSLDAVALRAGHFITGFRFYDLAALMYRPSRLLTGVRDTDSALTMPFAVVCCAAIAAALAPRFSNRPLARLGSCAPLALMVACAGVLYYQASQDAFGTAPDVARVGQALADLGNEIVRRSGALLTRHIALGAGTWVSGIGAVYLAYAGLRRSRPPAGAVSQAANGNDDRHDRSAAL